MEASLYIFKNENDSMISVAQSAEQSVYQIIKDNVIVYQEVEIHE